MHKKNFKINLLKILLAFLFIILTTISIVLSSFGNDVNVIVIIALVVDAIFFSITSVTPLWNKIRLSERRQKNLLSDNTFTDRSDDIENILKNLSIRERTIEIVGNEPNCGKTWLAKKIVDIINKKCSEKYVGNKKLCCNSAYYIDMAKSSEADIENIFLSQNINKKTLIVFDHVSNAEFIFSKQSEYHFNMIFILKDSDNHPNLFVHKVSNFERSNIYELQNRINQQYPLIDKINEKEIVALYDITNGNIGKIHTMLSRQIYIEWLKEIANSIPTDYDNELNKIQLKLYIGDYKGAKLSLDEFKDNYYKHFDNLDLFFKYQMIYSDCLHLLNMYEDAVAAISVLTKYEFINKEYNLELKMAHYYKHLWNCEQSLILLSDIESRDVRGLLDTLGIYLAKYFINEDVSVQKDGLECFHDAFLRASNRKSEISGEQLTKFNRYNVVYQYYFGDRNISSLINDLDKVIDVYNAQNNRLLLNTYFLKAEIYRLNLKYDSSILYYKKCLNNTEDNNIKIQVEVMKYYLKNIKNIEMGDNDHCKTIEQIKEMCGSGTGITNPYGVKLANLLSSIEMNDESAEKIIDNFDSRVMVIL